ncbi:MULTISPECIES: sugar ABC transporter permease [unclassified Yoonia]|uniref:carbohydrate ABC transporter permease n=1 Tax=unclassified Yoonia TaxID=2629118 RepID=UPI002AFDF49D|nr:MULTISPECIES: sugar ABC transporter permease [unclassified Yoonia]
MIKDRRVWLWFAPVLLVLGGVYLIPVADVIRFSFSDATLLRPVTGYGLGGYQAAFSDDSLGVILRNTGLFTLLSVVSLQAMGLAIALLLVRGDRRGLYGMSALRTIVLAAWVIPGIANGLIWQMLFSEAPFGAINSTLRLIGLSPVAWLSDPGNAMISAVIANVWQGSAFSMIVFYAARRAVDPVLYEAASVDGARPVAQFFFITLPQMRGALLVNTILVTIQTLNTFDTILALTGGGPGRATEVLSLNIFNRVFYSYDLGGGSALAVLLLTISMALTLVYLAVLLRKTAR